jgi:predicted metal-dependent hydrolase
MRVVSEKELSIPAIGQVFIRKKTGVKRISIVMRRQKSINVTIPYWASYSDGEKFLISKIDWVKKGLERISALENKKPLITNNTEINTLGRTIYVKPQFIDKYRIVYLEEIIIVEYPVEANIENLVVKKKIEELIKKASIKEAKQILTAKTKQLAQNYNISIQNIKIGSPRTRWGSCSYRNNINLNYRLIYLSNELCNYVIMHELTHTIHKNHSAKFWEKLVEFMPNALELNRELKKYCLL